MAQNLTIIHHALNAGEVSPRMTGRQDQNKYLASCETLLNAVPLVLGGAYVRPGTLFVAETKTVADHLEKRLIEFVAARDAAYIIEFGHEYVRFFYNGLPVYLSGTTPLELTTVYDSADLADIFTVQSVDVMYLLHRAYPVQKIQRTDVDTFTITEVNFDPPATIEDEPTGTDLGAGTLTPAATTGTGINFTAASAVWVGVGGPSGDIGRLIVFGGSRAVIRSITSTTVVVADIIDDFPNTSPIAAGDWRLRLSPQTSIDISNDIKYKGQTLTVTATDPAFRASDVGKFLVFFGGSGEIYNYTSASSVDVRLTADLKDVTVSNPAATRAWTLEVAAWSAALGYPSCGCFFQERLWLCKGLTINGSRTGDYENFGQGANADDAIARTLSDDDIDVIVWIKGYKTLKLGTGSGVFEASATSQGGALTPTSFKIEPIDPNGGARIMPLRVTPVLVYVQAGQRELRELAYSFADDSFKSPRLFRLADHLVDGYYLSELHFANQPDSIIYAVRNDGVLLGCVYEQVESVIGWYRLETDGLIKSAAIIPRPSSGKDWLWICVERDNGTFIEYFEPDYPDTGREWLDLHTDSAVVTTHDVNFQVTGLTHLALKTVRVVGDGMLFEDALVSSAGTLTLDPQLPVSKIEIGLPYEAIIVPVEPAVPAEVGGPFIARGYAEIGVRVRRTLGLTLRAYRVNINEPSESDWEGEQLVYRKAYHHMDQQVPLQRGKKCIINLGYDPFSRIEVKQSLPFPAEVLNVVGKLHVGDRWDCDTYNDSPVNFIPPVIVFPPPVPMECVSAEPEPTEFSVLCCYDKLGFGDLTGNDAGSLSYVAPDESWWSTESKMSGAGSGPYPISTGTQNWYLLEPIDGDDHTVTYECGIQDATGSAVAGGAPIAGGTEQYATQTAQAGCSGKSDEKSYILNIYNMTPGFTITPNNYTDAVVYFGESSGASYLKNSYNMDHALAWAKEANSFWTILRGSSPGAILVHYPIPAPAGAHQDFGVSLDAGVIPGWNLAVHDPFGVIAIHYSANYLYLLVNVLAGVSTKKRVYRIDKTSFAYAAHWDLNQTLYDLYTMDFFVSSDDIIFLLADDGTGSTFNIGYLRTSNGITTTLGSLAHQCTPAYSAVGVTAFHYRNGYFYISCGGAGGFGEANILKLGRLMCPSDATLPWEPPA